MPDLTSEDIALGRLALQQGALSRPQLDAAVALVRGGQAADLARALLRTGGMTVSQLEQLRAAAGGGAPAPVGVPPGTRATGGYAAGVGTSEAMTLHDDAEVTVGMAQPDLGGGHAAYGAQSGLGAQGTGYGAPATGYGPQGSAYGAQPPAYGAQGSAYGAQPPAYGAQGSAYGAQGSAYGAAPGYDAQGSAYGAAPGYDAPSAFATGPGAYGTNFGAAPTGGYPVGGGAPDPYGADSGAAYGAGSFGGPQAGFGDPAPDFGGFGASPAAPTTGVQEQVGPWVIEREIARGGMGAIYLGRHEKTQERAAVKVMLLGDAGASAKKVKRFLREIEANQKLVHPGIVRILDAGEWQGYPYFAMEFVEGKPLDRMLKDDLDLEIGMEILEAVARAVHYAHEQGIIHRDLKPANIIVQDDMQPKLTDFGLAKNADNQSVLTKTGAVIGTPYYLSPEQASGKSKDIDARADIYALGVMMYELATGRLPFVGQTTVELYNRIIHDEPVPPSKVKPQLTKALESVVLKAMAKHPEDRYPAAALLADDIRALLAGGTVAAKTDGAVARAVKRMRRRGTVPLVLGGTTLTLVLAVGGIVAHYKHAERQRHLARVQTELTQFEQGLEDGLKAAKDHVEQGTAALRQNHVPDALKAAASALDALDALDKSVERVQLEENRAPATAKLQEREDGVRAARADALVLRARATMNSNEADALTQAQDDLRTVLEQVRPDDPGALLAQGDLHVLAGKLNEALDQYRLALERSPGALRAQLGRARALFLLESFADAIPVLTQAIEGLAKSGAEAEPGLEARLLVERARTYLELGEVDKARQDAVAAAEKPGGEWLGKACLGEVLMRTGDRFAARDAFSEAIAAAKGATAGPLTARAEALLGAGIFAEALEDARTAVEQDPGSLQALVIKAEAEEALLHLQDAMRDAEAVTLRTHARDWRVNARAERVLARVHATNGNVKEAHDHAKKANLLDEASSAGRLLLAAIELDPAFEDQYLDNAEGLFKQVLRQRPRSLEAKRGLGLVTLAKHSRNPERAQNKLEDAYKEDESDPWTTAALARVYEERSLSDKARVLRAKGARFERDVRRREGLYFALGLREEKRARELEGAAQSQHLELARDAYRRAAWVDPLHAQALTGLASITHFQGARTRTEAHLKRATTVNPGSSQMLVLGALHAGARDVRDRDPGKALEAVSTALAKRGETLELLGLRALLTIREQPNTGEGETTATKIELALQRFDELRKRAPWSLENYRLEREMLAAARNLLPEGDALRQRLQDRDDEIRKRAGALGQDMDARDKTAGELRDRAESLLNSQDPEGALEAATEATRKAPWRADAWAMLARARARRGDVWGALAAGIRASHTDDRHAVELFSLLRSASRASDGDLAAIGERMVALDRDALPFEADLETLLRAAPQVARALVARPEVEVGKRTAELLETLVNHDPTLIAPQVLLGVLAYGADQDELAIQNLLFVAAVRDDAGEAYYLAAVVNASRRGASHADLVQAVEWLQASTFHGYEWADKGKKEARLDALRKSAFWGRLVEVSDDALPGGR